MTSLIIIAMAIGLGAQQADVKKVPPYQPPPDNSTSYGANITGSVQIVSQSNERVVLPLDGGPVIFQGFDKEGNLVLTVYRDGHVKAKDKKDLDEISKFFWKAFADYYQQQTGKCLGGKD